ncbi:MAG: alkaline phosphatase family protein, partial [Anaerolineae bacterium]|nr:alkaline phosphatase family protein [Anaerolineae bacterium]
LLLALPFGFLATFIFGLFANALTLLITARLLPFFQVDGLLAAAAGGLALAAVNILLTGIITLDDEGSFYEGLIDRIARLQTFRNAAEPGRGLVLVEIDGLSYWHMKHALENGLLPTLGRLMQEEGYVLSRFECGLPSQTSACQAGIMFGDNYDIPAFRWYDKEQRRLYVSGTDAAALNARYARGHGLIRGGSSINNMLNGDAEKSILTLADLNSGNWEQRARRAQDIYLLAANPYFLTRTVVLMLGDALLELFQYTKACLQNVRPRVDRLHRAYPLIRAVANILLRDVGAHLATLDILRGAPAIYVTWPGYDEVAHHSGPWSKDAFRVLRKYDRVFRRIVRFMREKAPRPYELIVLSDHGQSFGATFKQRYGLTLKEFIEQQLPTGTTVQQRIGGDNGIIAVSAVSGELANVQEQGMTGRMGTAVVQGGQRAAQAAVRRREGEPEQSPAAQVVVVGSGNLAQVYFDLHPRRVTLPELHDIYPGLVNALVAHEGIGLVGGYLDADTPVVLGKRGQRNLRTGEIFGEDPLQPYGDTTLRAWQIKRVMNFPHSGDLMVISTLYPDGTVAAFEELIGSHGGLGGEQTDAFLFHPPDMVVGPTRNAADLYPILNGRRGLPAPPPAVRPVAGPDSGQTWRLSNLLQGVMHQPSRWLALALRSLILDRAAFGEAADDPRMTGPALVLACAGLALTVLFSPTGWQTATWLEQIGVWLVMVEVIVAAGRLLGGRASYTRALRALGFAATAHLFNLLALMPLVAPLARLMASAAS